MLSTPTSVSTRTTMISIRPDGLMEVQALTNARWNVTLRLNVAVLNGMRVDGMDPNAI